MAMDIHQRGGKGAWSKIEDKTDTKNEVGVCETKYEKLCSKWFALCTLILWILIAKKTYFRKLIITSVGKLHYPGIEPGPHRWER